MRHVLPFQIQWDARWTRTTSSAERCCLFESAPLWLMPPTAGPGFGCDVQVLDAADDEVPHISSVAACVGGEEAAQFCRGGSCQGSRDERTVRWRQVGLTPVRSTYMRNLQQDTEHMSRRILDLFSVCWLRDHAHMYTLHEHMITDTSLVNEAIIMVPADGASTNASAKGNYTADKIRGQIWQHARLAELDRSETNLHNRELDELATARNGAMTDHFH